MAISRKAKKKEQQLLECARVRTMPSIIRPMLATLVDEPFSDPEWIFETKWDGFRSICFISNGATRFVSRNQIEMTQNYPELKNVAKRVEAKQAILDGEIVALDEHGLPRFQLLQPRVGRKSGIEALRGKGQIVYFVFDLRQKLFTLTGTSIRRLFQAFQQFLNILVVFFEKSDRVLP